MKDKIKQFLRKHPVNTGGAINEHKIIIKEIDDGDSYYRLLIPFWSNNEYVVDSVLNLIIELRKENIGLLTQISLREDMFVVDIYESICDPD